MKLQLITLSTLFCLCFSLSSVQAQNWWGNGVKGEGPVVRKNLDLDKFEAIKLTSSADVYLTQGNRQEVVVEAQQNIIDLMKKEVRGGAWKIGFEKNISKTKPIKIYITISNLTKISVSGSGNVKTEGAFTGLGKVGIHLSGSGDVKANLTASSIDTHISGSGNVALRGSAKNHDIHISGSGDVASYDFRTDGCEIHISGSGECKVNVQDDLDIHISGSGDVYYKGDPNVRSKVRGSGDVVSKG